MMTKGDIREIGEVVDKKVVRRINEFFEKVLSPYFVGEFGQIDKRLEGIDEKMKDNDEDHEEIFRKLNQNRDEHDRIFIKLDSIDKKVDGHETRIKRVEKTLQVS